MTVECSQLLASDADKLVESVENGCLELGLDAAAKAALGGKLAGSCVGTGC